METIILRRLFTAGSLLFAASVLGAPNTPDNLKAATAGIKDEKDRLEVQSALVEFSGSPRLKEFFAKSYGVVIFPSIGKAGLGVGGAHGSGFGFRQGRLDGESKMTQVSVGLQAGAQAFRQIIFFETEVDFNRFTTGNFELGAQASAVAITAGASAQAGTAGGVGAGAGDAQTKATYTDGMAIFTMAKGGLMYEASVGGQKFSYKSLKK